jgi:hypothetical protein
MIIDWPTEVSTVSALSWKIVSNVRSAKSDFTSSIQTYQQPGTRIQFNMTWNVLSVQESRGLTSFIASLDGLANRTMLWNLAKPEPAGNMRGAPTVSGAGQVGRQLNIDNAAPGHTLLRGDFIGISCVGHSTVVIVTEDVIAKADGTATVKFAPSLPSAAVDNSIIEWDKPKAKFHIVGESPDVSVLSGGLTGSLSMSFIQDLG